MAIGNKTTGAVNIQAPLDELALTLEETFGERSRTNEAIALRTLVAKQKSSRNFVEAIKENGVVGRKVSITWFDTCSKTAEDCSIDLCDAPEAGAQEELNKVDLEIENCWHDKFYVDEDLFARSKMSAMDYVQRELNRAISALLKKANQHVVETIDAGIGVTSTGDSLIEIPDYNTVEGQAMGMAILQQQATLANIDNPFLLNDGTWMLPALVAELSRADRQFPWVANQLMDIAFDPTITTELGAGEHGYLISPNAYAVGSFNYNPSVITPWYGRGNNGVEMFSIPTGVDGLVADVYVSRICKDAKANKHIYEYIVYLHAEMFLNPSECYFTDKVGTDVVTGIVKFGEQEEGTEEEGTE